MRERIERMRGAGRGLELLFLAIVVADFLRIVIRLIAMDGALGWDEALYANRARAWVDPTFTAVGWAPIRPPLLPLTAALSVVAGGEGWQLRIIGLMAGVTLLLSAWWLGRQMCGPVAGVASAAVLAMSPTLQVESAALLTDVPAAAMLLVLTAILWRQLEERSEPGFGLVGASALAGATFLMRYGAAYAIAPLLAVAMAVWWRRLMRAPFIVTIAALVGLAFVTGHLVMSTLQTGSPLGILSQAREVVGPRATPDSTFEQYLDLAPFLLAGAVGYVVMAFGLAGVPVAAVQAAMQPAYRPYLRALLLLVLPGAAYVALLSGTVAHAEARYFIYPTAVFVIAGCMVGVTLLRALPSFVTVATVVVLAAAILLTHGTNARASQHRMSEIDAYYRTFRIAGSAIGAVAGEDCGIVGGGWPLLAWYSGCTADSLRTPSPGASPGSTLSADERWAVIFTPLSELDPSEPLVAAVEAHASGLPMRISDPRTGLDIAVAWRLDR